MRKINLLIGAQLLDGRWCSPKPESTSSEMDEACLQFDTGSLSIHNPCALRCDNGLAVEFKGIIGNRVTDAYTSPDELIIVFEGRIYLSVSLREEDFIGSEAAVYRPASGPIVVFNG
jgi:hypothetical protein